MITVDTPVYPELRQLFGAYLNAEFADEYGSIAAALAAYRRETGAGHRAAARAELDRITAAPGALTRLDAELTALGCEVALANAGEAWGLAATIRRALETSA
jgi:hypothetical protein